MTNSERLSKIIREVQAESSEVIELSNRLVESYVKDMDNVISELEAMIDNIGNIEDIPDSQIEYFCVKIPALMYYASQKVEELGMQSDIARGSKKTAFNEAILQMQGTVVEKRAAAEKLTEDKAIVEAIYQRAYNSLKSKLDMAEKVYSGLKKSLSKRIAEVDLNKFSKDSYTGSDYIE